MRYQKAEDVLPAELLAQIQRYADGVYLYIPRRPDHRQSWGNSTRYREELRKRNESIRFLHREGCPMVENPGLIFFYVSQFMQEAVYHIPRMNAWVIAEPEDGDLTIHNIFADAAVTIEEVAEAFGNVGEIRLGFAPERADGWIISQIREEDTHFFVKGAVFGEFEERKLRIPSLSHA